MVIVKQWAELPRLHFGQGLDERARPAFALERNAIRRGLRSAVPPRYVRRSLPSKLDPLKEKIHRLLHDEPRLPNTRIAELIAPLGYASRQTILDAYLREVRSLLPAGERTSGPRTDPEIAQFDLWEPVREISVASARATRIRQGRRGSGTRA